MQFAMSTQTVKLADVNPRAEKHGEDNVMAADLKIEANCHSSVLDLFDRALRAFLYRKPASGEQPSLIEGDDLTGLAHPKLAPLSWDEELPGYVATVHEGLGLQDPLILDCDLKNFRIEPIEGGSVKLTFRVVCHPDAEQMGQLCALIQDDIELSLAAPSAT